jgi:hypothetical protein
MKAFRKELAQRLGRALIKSSHHSAFGQTGHCRDMAPGPLLTHFGLQSVREPTSIQNDSGLAQRLN